MGKVIGIDLGTTFSCVAVMEAGEPKVITNAEGGRTTPSVVAISKTGERLTGQVARRQAITNPDNTIFSIKRLMGRKFEEPTVEYDRKLLPFKITKAANDDAWVKMGDKEYSPPEISAMILQKLKVDAEAYLGEKVTEAVITVPAYFNDSQRQATKDAGKIAGLEVLRIINEPTAASLAYGLDKKGEETIAVYDLGGGTFDISILELGEGTFQVKSTNGDTHLGGDDFDQKIMAWLCNEFKREQGIDLRQDKMALQRLKEAAEKAKCELSTVQQTEVNLPFITADASGPKHLSITLTRAKLEQLIMDLVEKSIGPCWQALTDAGKTTAQIDEVVQTLTKAGEATVQTDVAIQELIDAGKTTVQINKLIEALANARKTPAQINKVIQALTKAGKITAQIDEIDEVILVGGQTRTPLVHEKVKQFFSKEPHKGVNPDEVVAVGAAIQAGVLKGEVKDVLLLDVTPLTLGIETLGGVATPLIPRNTTIPTEKSQIFSTAADNQPSVDIHVLQGERPMATDNRTLGKFMLDGILPAPRGMPQIEVSFDIDANGILNVKAHDKGTGKEQKITITASSGLAKDEVEKMQREAETHAAEDAKRREEIEARNAADTLAYTAEKTLRDQKDKIPSDLNQEVETKIAAVRSALQGSDIDAVRRATQELNESLQKVGAAIYKQQQQPPPPPGEEPPGKEEGEGTVEGEFREV